MYEALSLTEFIRKENIKILIFPILGALTTFCWLDRDAVGLILACTAIVRLYETMVPWMSLRSAGLGLIVEAADFVAFVLALGMVSCMVIVAVIVDLFEEIFLHES